MLNRRYFSPALLNCYEGDDAGVPDLGAGTIDPIAGAAAAVGANPSGGKTFTQDEVNIFLAKEKGKHQASLLKMEEGYKKMLAEGEKLSAKDRALLEENLATVQGQLRTKEEQAKMERKQLEDQLQAQIKDANEKAASWETRYRTESVDRSLQDAAVSADAYQPSQIVTLLKPMTRLVEDIDPKTGRSTGKFNAMVDFPDVDSEGQPTVSVMNPRDAVKRMKQLPEIYGNLFKSGVVPGIGSNSGTGVIPGQNGKLNLRGLTPEQYRKLRAEDPQKLGLRK